MKIGILFGGQSREREVSFAGGRTIYDNLDKNIFEPVPIFVDSLGNFILLNWEFIYKGTIRDFYPPIMPTEENPFQIYIESLQKFQENTQEIISKVGKQIFPHQFPQLFDFAFLTLHGAFGEDGNIQGLLEWYNIPYSGSGILPSAIGIDKIVQSEILRNAGFKRPKQKTILRKDWLTMRKNILLKKNIFAYIKDQIGFPIVVKSPKQGSSIGVSIIKKDTENPENMFLQWEKAVNKNFFMQNIDVNAFKNLSETEKRQFLTQFTDIREGLGFPVFLENETDKKSDETEKLQETPEKRVFYHPTELQFFLQETSLKNAFLCATNTEEMVLFEEFIAGKEFSCIVIQDETGNPVALPPTEIRKYNDVFDYRSKYLPGTSRKITPIEVADNTIKKIRNACVELYKALFANVYARIDGFITEKNEIFLNDPNTTSGMLPSSFFFHQSAEIGLDSKDFITYIIRTSLSERQKIGKNAFFITQQLENLDKKIQSLHTEKTKKISVAVIMGGYSSERHISMESGRNVYEKLASSTKYAPFPVFLTGNSEGFEMYEIPINYMLKDNADDIREKISQKTSLEPTNEKAEILDIIKAEFVNITNLYAQNRLDFPQKLTFEELKNKTSLAFIALHGRPGEDGALQQELQKWQIAYNGSGVKSSQITINKYQTNEILAKNNILVAKHTLVYEHDWLNKKTGILNNIAQDFTFPLIAKPADDGCSSAVKKLKNVEQFCAFAEMMFRKQEEFLENEAQILQLTPKEEFPQKNYFLVEELITKGDKAIHFLEITGGMLTKFEENTGEKTISYEIFPPSETLSTGDVLSLEEKFLAGEGQNITPARYFPQNPETNAQIEQEVKNVLERTAKILNVEGYCRIDAFVRVFAEGKPEVIIIEVNSLPGMTPATCIFHQASLHDYKPYQFIDKILDFGDKRNYKL